MNLSPSLRAWLLDAPEPYIRYNVARLIEPESADPSLLGSDLFVRENLKIVSRWRDEVVTRHDKSDLFYHRLSMLADIGVTRDTEGAQEIVDDLLSGIENDGSFRMNIMIPKAFGGTGETHPDWVICDFPSVVYVLVRMAGNDPRTEATVRKLAGLCGDRFYPCTGSIPKFKGPGPRDGMCPYANLLAARALGVHPDYRLSDAAKKAGFALLDSWKDRKTKKAFLFGMGTDFKKIKFPMIWYNILHVLSALSLIEEVNADPRFLEMADILRSKLDMEGRVVPESIYMPYRTQEWSDKKHPSRLLTLFVHQVLERIPPVIHP